MVARLQRTYGNRYVQRLLAPVVQPKLLSGATGDRFEREADRLAQDLADAELAGGHLSPRTHPHIARAGQIAGSSIDPAVSALVLGARGRGRPLPADERRGYERALGASLGGVRLHTGHVADDINFRLRASAVAAGQDIYFRHGAYDPASDAGSELLVHELVHVVQQSGGDAAGAGDAPALVQLGRDQDRSKRPRGRGGRGGRGRDRSGLRNRAPRWKRVRAKSWSASSGSDLDDPDYELSGSESQPKPGKPKRKPSHKDGASRKKPKPRGEDIEVGYLTLEEMEEHLGKEPRPAAKQDPKPMSLGVVVWNINHLSAEGGKDDIEVVADAEDIQDRPRKKKPAPAKSYDADRILEAVKTVKAQLREVSAALLKATGDEDRRLERSVAKGVSETRKEISLLRHNIEELLRDRDLSEVLTPGITAMAEFAGDPGKRPIDTRASLLVRIRALGRVWNRFDRLNAVLFTGQAKLEVKIAARTRIRKAMGEAGDGLREALSGLLKLLGMRDLRAAVSSLKKSTVVDLTTDTFFTSQAVDLVLINEMNLGMPLLDKAATQSKGQIGVSPGPRMLAKGEKTEKGAKGKQNEYYPAVHRAGLKPEGTFYVSTDGEFAVQEGGKNSDIPWDKDEDTFRGIVVHRYTRDGQEFWAGVLHTTPKGKNLDRRKIWPQIEKPLMRLNKLATQFRIPLLVGGDFYIAAEGIVDEPGKQERAELWAKNRDLLTTVKLWNLARGVFLRAAVEAEKSPGELDALIADVSKTAKPKAAKPASWPERLGRWQEYRTAVRRAIEELSKGKYDHKAAMRALAPDRNYEVGWKETLAAGTISGLDILRNIRRPQGAESPGFTLQLALQPLGYRVVEGASPTNPKEGGRGEDNMQLADLFLVNDYWQVARGGIATPSGQLKPVDDSALSATRTYWKISDHSPVLMLGSTVAGSDWPHRAFDMAKSAPEQAVAVNHAIWDDIATSLDGLTTRSGAGTVAEQVAAIKELLKEPLAGPGTDATDRVLARAAALGRSIDFPEGIKRTEAQDKALDRIARWRPVYTTDFGEDSPSKEPPQSKPPTGKPPEQAPPGGLPQGVQVPPPAWPTGQVEHWRNSCYLSALIHVLASDQHFIDLLNPVSLTATPEQRAFRRDSGLRTLVTTLRDPHGRVTEAEIEVFMRFLDGAGVLGGPAGSGASKEKILSEAGTVAEKAIKTGKAIGMQHDAAEILLKVLTRLGSSEATRPAIRTSLAPVGFPTAITSTREDPQTVLTLPIPVGPDASIAKALRMYSAPTPVPGYRGRFNLPYAQQLQFYTLPRVLTIALSRFRRTDHGTTVKISSWVVAETTLEIPPVCMTPQLIELLHGRRVTYRLVHVAHHSGERVEGGHYTSFGRLPGNASWYKHDDLATGPRRTVPEFDDLTEAMLTGYLYVYVRNPLPPGQA